MNWSSNYHNLLWVFLFMCAASFALLPGSSEEAHAQIDQLAAEKEIRETELKHGRYESLDSNGKLKSVVNYQYGKKHGVSYLYYPNGKIHLEMTYNTNMREGISKKYYQAGQVYATTPYVKNKINGIRTTYYESGKVRATVPYLNSWPGVGLKEYLPNGKERTLLSGIGIEKRGDVWLLKAKEPCRKQEFYLGNLTDGQYLDKRRLKLLPLTGDGAVLDLKNISEETKVQGIAVVCRCTTYQNNPLILSKRL